MANLDPISDAEIVAFLDKVDNDGVDIIDMSNAMFRAFDRIEIETANVNRLAQQLNKAISILKKQSGAMCLLAETIDFIKEVEGK
jgi:hypothetical protein